MKDKGIFFPVEDRLLARFPVEAGVAAGLGASSGRLAEAGAQQATDTSRDEKFVIEYNGR